MTIKDVLNDSDFNKSSLSEAIFGSKRTISDKERNNRGKRWTAEDREAIAKYFYDKWKINLETT